MADRYVYHGGSNTSPYDTWAKAATTLATAVAAGAAGDDYWVASDHSESTASALTLSITSSSASPCRIISVSRAGSTPPVAADILAGGAVATTGASSITIGGFFYCYGLTFSAGSSTNTASLNLNNTNFGHSIFDTCSLILGNSSASSVIQNTAGGCRTDLTNSTMTFGATGQGVTLGGALYWTNKPGSAAVLGTIPTALIKAASGGPFPVRFSGLDLSAAGSGKTLVDVGRYATQLINCKLGASVTVAATPTTHSAPPVDLIGCSSSSNVRRDERYRYQGTLTTETTIKRTAGASDGTTPFSHKIVTTANAKRIFPFESFEGAIWNDTTGSSKTLTVHTVTDNVTLTDAEIWLEVEYLGDASYPVTSLVTDANATILTTAANQASDSSEAWTTTGLTTPVKQKLEVTFTPQMKGLIRFRVKVAKASTTVYICPQADLS